MKTRVGELWEVWSGLGNEPWRTFLVIKTEALAYDTRVHTCLFLDVAEVVRVTESLTGIWDATPRETVCDGVMTYNTYRRRVDQEQ